jgi:hypothetical protein
LSFTNRNGNSEFKHGVELTLTQEELGKTGKSSTLGGFTSNSTGLDPGLLELTKKTQQGLSMNKSDLFTYIYIYISLTKPH